MSATAISSPIRWRQCGATTRSPAALSRPKPNRRCATTWPTIAATATASSATPPSCWSTSASISIRCTPNSGRSLSDSMSESRIAAEMTPAHSRLSVHNVTFLGAALAELEQHWAALGVPRLSILDSQLLDPEFAIMLRHNTYTVEAVYHLFAGGRLTSDPRAAQQALLTVIDAAAAAGARLVYLLTGGRDGLS